ncbi:MAG: Toprim subdomain protein [Candidatus Methanomethylophilaceae archaeon]
MNDRERLDELWRIFDRLAELAEDHTILVEGNRDRKALEFLGKDIDVIEVQREGGPIKAAERVFEGRRKAVILTDWDDRGDKIAEDLSIHLAALDVEYDTAVRSRLADICRKDIKDVEGIPALCSRLEYLCDR